MSLHPLTQIEQSASELAQSVRNSSMTNEQAESVMQKVAMEIFPEDAQRAEILRLHGLYLYRVFVLMPPMKPPKHPSLQRLHAIERAAKSLVEDVKRRHPGESLHCPLMRALEEALMP